eukprot:scaffold56477_cov54-Phaeocystis_antarctica.AAC.4
MWPKCPLGSARGRPPAPPQGAPGGSGRLEAPMARGLATGCPATALGAPSSRLQSRRFYRL